MGAIRRTWIGVLLLVGLAAAAEAQYTGVIRGTVHDSSGRAMPGAVVTISHPATRAVRVAVTDVHGNYQVTGLEPDTPYVVHVTHPDFRRQKIQARAFASEPRVTTVRLTARRSAARH